MLCNVYRLAALACLALLSGCSAAPQASAWPGLMDCPRPSPQLLQRVPALPPIPTQPKPPASESPQTPTSAPGPWQPEPNTKRVALAWTL